MRSVFVFPAGELAETVDSLDQYLPEQRDPWTVDGNLYIEIVDEEAGYLFSDWDPDDVAVLGAAVGHRPTWAVQIDISGRIDGAAEVHQLVELLLEYGGVATDDYSAHPWTLQEIKFGVVNDGLHFFDFRTYHELNREYGLSRLDHRATASSEKLASDDHSVDRIRPSAHGSPRSATT